MLFGLLPLVLQQSPPPPSPPPDPDPAFLVPTFAVRRARICCISVYGLVTTGQVG